MKLIGLGLLGLASADVGAVYQEVAAISKQISKIESHDTLTTKLGVAVNKDIKVHKDLAKNLKQRSAAQRGACSLHWSLCPNMCQVDYELKYKFEEIRGNKMKKFKQFSDELVDRRDKIVIDLEGKAAEVYDWESQVNKNSLDLERLEDAFILELQNDLKQAIIVNDGLKALDDGMQDLAVEFNQLSVKISRAHVDCEGQAPCMAVPVCKLHAASGNSCADVVNKNMDKDEEGSSKNHAQSGLYLISPGGLEAKTAICENDQLGGSFTVIQNRKNGSEPFDRNWDDYKNGFGTVAALDSAACEEGEFWLGNEYIYAMQNKGSANALKIRMSRHDGQVGQVSYSNFKVASEREQYQLQRADGFKDDTCGVKVGNSLAGMNFGSQGYGQKDIAKTVHVGMKFSTPDRDNDKNRRANCAQQDRSGWWFNSCSAANLNGFYHGGKYSAEETRTGEFDDGVLWNTWTNDKFEALTKTRMSFGQDKGFSSRMCDATTGGDYEENYEDNYGGGDDNNRGDNSNSESNYGDDYYNYD